MQDNLIIIVILNLNRSKDLVACLDSVYAQNIYDKEIIVIDNGSVDDSINLVKTEFPKVTIIESKFNLGVAGGRNIGIKTAFEKFDFKYILFLDNDVILEKDFLSYLVNSFSLNNEIGIAAPKCISYNEPRKIEFAGGINVNLYTGNIKNIGNGQPDNSNFIEPKFLKSSGGLFMTTKSVLNSVGFFDEKFNPYGWEDVDFSLRVRQKGFKIYYNPKAIVYHKGGKRVRTDLVEEYESSKIKNYFYLLKKHATILQRFTLIFCLPFILIFSLANEMFIGNHKLIIYKFKGLAKIIFPLKK